MSFPDQETSSPSSTDSASSAKERALILVVERNPAVQRLEKFFLEQAGYTVEFATDGIAALELARELKPKIRVGSQTSVKQN